MEHALLPCPRCGNQTDTLVTIEPGMRIALAESGGETPPDRTCSACFDQLTGSVSQGLKLRMERDVREKNKMLMWKGRVTLIKNARGFMMAKSYSEAAVQYEKYIRVLEIVYNLNKGDLSPAVFNNSKRSKELTVIASVYWDLVRIYDSSARYGDRMQASAQKLSEFLPFSTVYPDIVKKAEIFAKSARNPAVMKNLLRATKSSRGPCFVADAAFAHQPHALEPFIFRRYRDEHLRRTVVGRRLIWAYYQTSPRLARVLRRHPRAAALARVLLVKLARRLKKNLKSDGRVASLTP